MPETKKIRVASLVAWMLEVVGVLLIGAGLFFVVPWAALLWAGVVLIVAAVVVERGNP